MQYRQIVFALSIASFSLAVQGELEISTTGCGVTKGCFRSPENCEQYDCTYLVTYLTNFDDDTVDFEVAGKVAGSSAYFTMGIGDTQTMDNIYTIGCFINGSETIVRDGATIRTPRSHVFAERNNIGVTNIASEYANSTLSFRFSRARAVGENVHAKDLSQNDTYYLIAATGSSTSATGFGYHRSSQRWFTTDKIAFDSFTALSAGGPSLLLRLHGSLMLVAWMAIGIIGILLALHYRITISKTELLGSRSWLKLHRVLQITAVVFTAASFVLVFVAVNELHIGEGVAAAHPILGIIIMSLVLLNGIVIFSRRLVSIDHTKLRTAVSTSHMVMGRALYILSAANIILGLLLDSMQLDMWTVYTIGGLIGATVAVEIALYAHAHSVESYNTSKRNEVLNREQTYFGPPSDDNVVKFKSLRNNGFRISLLIGYSIVATAIVVVVLCAIFGVIPSQTA